MPQALVVDDSRAMRAILGKQLKQLGYEVLEAEHGEQALERLAACARPPALALVDWNMPRMNGIELVRAVRGKSEFASMRIMMVTTETELSRRSASRSMRGPTST
jgi:two-component system chemotaxis response regulator CheY